MDPTNYPVAGGKEEKEKYAGTSYRKKNREKQTKSLRRLKNAEQPN